MEKKKDFNRIKNMRSYDELIQKADEDNISTLDRLGPKLKCSNAVEIPLNQLYEFQNHPFKILDDRAMKKLTESVKMRGVINPAIVRKRAEGEYEIISGHRRKYACEKANMQTMPVYVVDMTDDEAIIWMADSNLLQRERLLTSEKAKAYRMKSEAITRHQGRAEEKSTMDELRDGNTDSSSQIKRYIRLSYLSDDLLNLVDKKQIGIDQGVQLSYLNWQQQRIFSDCLRENFAPSKVKITKEMANRIREEACNNSIDRDKIISILLPSTEHFTKRRVVLDENKLSQFFSVEYGAREMENIILQLLEEWKIKTKG